MNRCRCEECRASGKTRRDRSFHNPLRARWRIDEAIQRYYARWLEARDRTVEKCIADILGHAREHHAVDFEPAPNVFAGIDRGTDSASLQWASKTMAPFSFETFREAIFRIMSAPIMPPVRPWLFRRRFEQLVAEGIPAALIRRHFEIY